MKHILLMCLLSILICACHQAGSPSQQVIKQAELYESGITHADETSKAAMGTLQLSRHPWGDLLVHYGMQFDCSTHVHNAVTWAEKKQDHIQLCYQLLENNPKQDTVILGACPQTLMLVYQFQHIPEGQEPEFRVNECDSPPTKATLDA